VSFIGIKNRRINSTFSHSLDPLRTAVTVGFGVVKYQQRGVATTLLLGQIHLPQERLVTRVGCKICEQRLADDFDETTVLLFVRTFEPLKCKIVIVPVGIEAVTTARNPLKESFSSWPKVECPAKLKNTASENRTNVVVRHETHREWPLRGRWRI
jgi:hypothetical protein